DEAEISIGETDPWGRIRHCAEQVESDLHALQTMKSPRFINGWKPWLILTLIWLALSAPAFLFPSLLIYWLPVAALILPAGYWLVTRLRRQTNGRIISLWLSLRHAAHLARRLRPIYLRLAKKTYISRKRASYKHNRKLLKASISATRTKLLELRVVRDKALRR